MMSTVKLRACFETLRLRSDKCQNCRCVGRGLGKFDGYVGSRTLTSSFVLEVHNCIVLTSKHGSEERTKTPLMHCSAALLFHFPNVVAVQRLCF